MSMHETEIGKAVQLLDLMLDCFADDGHWARGCYDDGNGGHCLVGALLHLSRKHRIPAAPAIALLQDAMPRPGLPLVHFNDHRCGSLAELRSVIVKARRLAHDDAERERAAAAVKTWLLARIEQQRAAATVDKQPASGTGTERSYGAGSAPSDTVRLFLERGGGDGDVPNARSGDPGRSFHPESGKRRLKTDGRHGATADTAENARGPERMASHRCRLAS